MDKITAFQILQEIYDKSLFSERTALEYLFPELKVSEDERIRKTIIRFFKDNYPNETEMYDGSVTVGKALAWLEKQGKTKVEQTDSHDYVEIGGVKWATKNVGAEKITDKGLYFQWGDTQGYTAAQVPSEKAFDVDDYKYGKYNYNDPNKGMTKYNRTDTKTVLYSEDDAVTAAWGSNWRMPTHEEYKALFEATTSDWVENYNGSGVSGRLFTSKEDSSKTLFFPAAGDCGGGNVWDVGIHGCYWSRSLYKDSVNDAWGLDFYNGGVYDDNFYRYYGYSVRGVMNC